jgi:quercetin dioxygenase-like cupin family protein
MKNTLMVITLCLVLAPIAAAQAEKEMAEPNIYSPADIVWKDGPSAIPPGAKIARLEGDSAKEGFYTMRLLFPAGYKIPPHTHPQVEQVTVISGALQIGMGEKFDEGVSQTIPAGGFFAMPAGMKHFAWTKVETVIQLNGVGPQNINYLNPEDDPRTAKK